MADKKNNKNDQPNIPADHRADRRNILKSIAGFGLTASVQPALTFAAPRPKSIAEENAKPGTTDWMLKNTRIDPDTKFRCPWIEGYTSKIALAAGDSLDICVSTNPPSPFTIDIYRMGYYGGKGGRHLATLGPFKGSVQPDPPIGKDRLRECKWTPAATLTIPDDWLSGVYLGKMTAETSGLQSYVVFIVRDDRRADFLFQCSDTTWHAYNRWPSQFALYDDGQKNWYWGPDVAVSYDRPFGKYCQIFDVPLSTGSGEFLLWEFPLAFWMEKHGYDVTYVSNMDTHANPAGLRRGKGLLSVGHDEYWSIDMFNHVKSAVADGINVAFFSANTCCGVISIDPSHDGRPNRIISRIGQYGPIQEETLKNFPELAKLRHNGPNEATLIGARSTYPVTGGGPWVCAKEDHWLFRGSGMKNGDGIPGLVGWEWHGDPADIPGLEIVAEGPTQGGRAPGHFTATMYPGPKGNFVFNGSTIWWADGLSAPPGYVRPKVYTEPMGPDPRVQRITQNLLNRMRT
jgi:hypothetical protein